MRTIEALSLGRKVITTNINCTMETFYHKDNFLLWPYEKDRLINFIETPFNEGSFNQINSLAEWLDKMEI